MALLAHEARRWAMGQARLVLGRQIWGGWQSGLRRGAGRQRGGGSEQQLVAGLGCRRAGRAAVNADDEARGRREVAGAAIRPGLAAARRTAAAERGGLCWWRRELELEATDRVRGCSAEGGDVDALTAGCADARVGDAE